MADLPKPLPASQWQHDMWTANQLRTYAAAQVAEAVAAERERCARLAETAQFTGNTFPRTQLEQLRIDIADAIRATEAPAARSET
jgi:hypothetical protein